MDSSVLDLYGRRACAWVMSGKINRFEVWMLSAMRGYFNTFQVVQVGKSTLFRMITGSPTYKKKLQGYWWGLLSKGYIQLAERQFSRGESYTISPLGWEVLRLYDHNLKALIRRYRVKAKKDIKQAA